MLTHKATRGPHGGRVAWCSPDRPPAGVHTYRAAWDEVTCRECIDLAPSDARTKDPAAVALGRRGGLKGGRARAERMTPEERSAAASWAARCRWKARAEGGKPQPYRLDARRELWQGEQ